jgi:hypothetical protein
MLKKKFATRCITGDGKEFLDRRGTGCHRFKEAGHPSHNEGLQERINRERSINEGGRGRAWKISF